MDKKTRNFMIVAGVVTLIIIVAPVVAAGWMRRSAMILPMFTTVYVALYIHGKVPEFKQLLKEPALKVVGSVLITFLIQAVLVTVLYLLGYGLSAAFGHIGDRTPLQQFDFLLTGGLLVVGFVVGIGMNRLKKKVFTDISEMLGETQRQLNDLQNEIGFYADTENEGSGDAEIKLTTAVTHSSLISGPHFQHIDEENSATGSQEKIDIAEARLGVTLPNDLRAIYLLQNGATIEDVCIPDPDVEPNALRHDDVLMPFGGYDALHPLESLETLWESFTGFADPDDPEDEQFFRSGTENMIAISQWYRYTLYLDYNTTTGEPRVAYVDFDHSDWENNVRWWPTFTSFFNQLRHFEDA